MCPKATQAAGSAFAALRRLAIFRKHGGQTQSFNLLSSDGNGICGR